MRAEYTAWAGLFIIAILVTLAAKYFAYFPGDVTVEKWVQSLVTQNVNWAQAVSRTAEFPWILIILAFIAAISWGIAGWRAVLVSILSFVGMWALGNWLGPFIGGRGPQRNWST